MQAIRPSARWCWVVALAGVIGCGSSTGDGASCEPEDCIDLGGGCTEHLDCCGGYCDVDGFCGPTDIGYRDGEVCDMDYHCVDHGYCGVEGVCETPQCGAEGQVCDRGDTCCSGTCADGSCTERVTPVDECTCIVEDATCYWDDDCCRGLYCGEGTCVPWPS